VLEVHHRWSRKDGLTIPKTSHSARRIPLAPDRLTGLAESKLATQYSADEDFVFAHGAALRSTIAT